MNHASAHGNRRVKNMIKQRIIARVLEGCDTACRKCQINRLCKVERRRQRITEVYGLLARGPDPLIQNDRPTISKLVHLNLVATLRCI